MKTTITAFLLSFLCATSSCSLLAQPKKEYTTKKKKAIDLYEDAGAAYSRYEYTRALELLEECTQVDPNFVEPYLLKAQVLDEMGNTHGAIAPLEKALALNPTAFPIAWMMLSECHFAEGNYKDAEKAISTFMPYPKNDVKLEKRCNLILSSCIYAQNAQQHPVPFDPVNLGASINTEANEYYPCITADEQTLLFTREVPSDIPPRYVQEDFYITRKEGDSWAKASPVASINTPQNEGAPTLSADGQVLIFTACEIDGFWGAQRTGVGSCDLFYSARSDNGWSAAKNLGNTVNSGSWESQPSYSADGRTLYFVRGKRTAQGIKEQDIYYSYINDDGRWVAPMKVPGKVNTIFEEESVMIHPDGRTMYFSSNGHSGMGGLDIFMSRMLPSGDWDTPINLGFPINTYKDENSFQVTSNGKYAFFASERAGGMGGLDLYMFELYEGAQPTTVTYVHGVVSDKLSYKKLESHLELIDLETGKVVRESYSNAGNGEFLLCIPAGKDYALNVNKEGYLFHSENFSLKNYTSIEPFELNIKLQKLRPGATIVLNNIFFETNKYDLKDASKAELNKLVALLQANAAVKVEIGGHTDNVGSEEANRLLSENRAKAVVEYLTKAGIAADRLSAKGYGETQPVADNETETGRAANRRTEFKVVQ